MDSKVKDSFHIYKNITKRKHSFPLTLVIHTSGLKYLLVKFLSLNFFIPQTEEGGDWEFEGQGRWGCSNQDSKKNMERCFKFVSIEIRAKMIKFSKKSVDKLVTDLIYSLKKELLKITNILVSIYQK